MKKTKEFKVFATFEDGVEKSWPMYRQEKRARDLAQRLYKNYAVKSVEVRQREVGTMALWGEQLLFIGRK